MARTRPTLKSPQALGSILEGPIGRKGARLVDLYRIQKSWVAIAGENVAQRTFPRWLKGTTLTIAVENSGWSQQLGMIQEELRRAVFSQAGVELKEIRFENEPGRVLEWRTRYLGRHRP